MQGIGVRAYVRTTNHFSGGGSASQGVVSAHAMLRCWFLLSRRVESARMSLFEGLLCVGGSRIAAWADFSPRSAHAWKRERAHVDVIPRCEGRLTYLTHPSSQ